MKIIVCGGRDFTDYKYINSNLDALHQSQPITCVVHGDARGVDRAAAQWATKNKIMVIPYPADWNKYGNSAGPIRNTLMLKEERPEAVVAFPGGAGTDHMKKITKRENIRLIEFDPDMNVLEFLS